jgi:hypothetical protein
MSRRCLAYLTDVRLADVSESCLRELPKCASEKLFART